MIGSNRDENDVAVTTVVTINSVTATTISVANALRLFFSVSLAPGITSLDAFIRLYPAATDNLQQGIPLTRRTAGNDVLFKPTWMSPKEMYVGEISAISLLGTFDLHITEY